VDRLPLLIMITVSIGFFFFPMHLYNVVRAGVDPLIAKITRVVPIADAGAGFAVTRKATGPVGTHDAQLLANNPVPLTTHPSREPQ